MFTFVAIDAFTVAVRAYGESIEDVSLIFNFRLMRLLNVAVSTLRRYGVNIAAVSLIFTLLLNVLQSVDDNAPLLVADAVGKLNVCVALVDDILKLVPVVPVAKN